MANYIQKYRATMFQLGGFALMSPLGKIILNALDFSLKDLFTVKFTIYFLIAFLLFCVGIIFMARGLNVLEGKV